MTAEHEILMVGEEAQPIVDHSERLDDALYSVSFEQTGTRWAICRNTGSGTRPAFSCG